MNTIAVAVVFATHLAGAPVPAPIRPFEIQVVDEATGRGVPLVELETVHHVRYVTDSAGRVAFAEPGLMDQRVFFHVASHGYEFPKDGFGMRGRALQIAPGGRAVLKIKRLNIAERLYRITGGGIYRDSVLLGHSVPIRQPLLNAKVLGQDSVQTALYRGRVYWFWGDTNRPGYPLGNFHMPGATSLLPSAGGLDPAEGVNLTYFVDKKTGFAKPTCQMPGEGPSPTWADGFIVLPDAAGKRHLLACYAKVRHDMSTYRRGLVEWDDTKNEFRQVREFPLDTPAYPYGHPFLHGKGDQRYVYYGDPFPLVRCRATREAWEKLDDYEAFTCLKPGSGKGKVDIDRGPDGRARYAWRKGARPLGSPRQEKLIRAGTLKRSEALLQVRDVETGKPIVIHRGTVRWNAYRKRWIMIAGQLGGTSMLGEIWYAESDNPLGPWTIARKIVTHEKYSLYNPKHHAFFDQAGGRLIYFEGTYVTTFSGNPHPTPRYDYNQIMYRLDLSDKRLAMPGTTGKGIHGKP